MVDVPLMAALLSALRGGCRLVLVGDPDQLPSVGPGCLFSDLIRSGVGAHGPAHGDLPQAAQSAIVRNAHMVNAGELPESAEKRQRLLFPAPPGPPGRGGDHCGPVPPPAPGAAGIPTDQIQVLSPTRRRGAGTTVLNQALQAALNPPDKEKGERRFGDWIFRTGDRVMQVKNNYDILWREEGGSASGMGMFNGDIGVIRLVDRDCHPGGV